MKGKILGLFFSVLSFVSYGQTIDGKLYTNFNNYYKWRGGAFDTTLLIPQTASPNGKRPGALYYNSADSSVYSWSGSQWRKVSGTPIDTSSLSNRIDLRVKYSDTASMLSPYLRKIDTASISNRIDLKFNISDTATMLTTYLRKVDTTSLSNRIDLRVRYSDTANMLSPYLNSSVAAATYQLILDTIPLAAFGAGSGAAGDTLAFSTSAVYGSFYNAGNDTLIITQMRAGVLGTSPSITTEVYWNDSLNITAGATILVTGGTSVTGTIGATNVTSFTNNKIPPNVWVFVRTSAVATKPTYFTLTLLGYRKRQ